jgi:hypothetical protein
VTASGTRESQLSLETAQQLAELREDVKAILMQLSVFKDLVDKKFKTIEDVVAKLQQIPPGMVSVDTSVRRTDTQMAVGQSPADARRHTPSPVNARASTQGSRVDGEVTPTADDRFSALRLRLPSEELLDGKCISNSGSGETLFGTLILSPNVFAKLGFRANPESCVNARIRRADSGINVSATFAFSNERGSLIYGAISDLPPGAIFTLDFFEALFKENPLPDGVDARSFTVQKLPQAKFPLVYSKFDGVGNGVLFGSSRSQAQMSQHLLTIPIFAIDGTKTLVNNVLQVFFVILKGEDGHEKADSIIGAFIEASRSSSQVTNLSQDEYLKKALDNKFEVFVNGRKYQGEEQKTVDSVAPIGKFRSR